jgi:hypothetical protein
MAAKMSLFVLLASGIRAASAQEVRMTCQGSGKSYWVSYDPKTRQFRSNHAEAGSGFKVKRDQVDKEGVLVWIGAGHLGGERDMLVFFGQEEKWVRLFFGNGSQVLERCR